jgi:RNA polymerase sigma-70 factor (ECF subfamily)
MTVEALRKRRPEALEDLLAMYGREIQAVAWLILRDRAAAEDVVAETLLTAYDRIGSLRDERALRSWLLRIATNHALGMRRRGSKVVQLHVVPERAGADFRASSTDRVALLAGLEDLPPAMRAAVVLRYYADLPVDEVAMALGKSPNTIKAQLQAALDRLRASLADSLGASLPEANHA